MRNIFRVSSMLAVMLGVFFLVGCGASSTATPSNSSSSTFQASSLTAEPAPEAAPVWDLVWSDEFEDTTLNLENWQAEVNCWGGGNNEQQCYTAREDNAYVSDGVLHLVAKSEVYTGNNGVAGDDVTLGYTSARLRTKGLHDWTFGRFEIRAKLPYGQGTWPAIWMLPTDSPYGTWASSGEIDIMEAVNLTVDGENRVFGTLHYGRNWPGNVHAGTSYQLPSGVNPAHDFHVYALEWEEGEIRWYVDDVHYATQQQDGWYSQFQSDGQWLNGPVGAPFDSAQKYHLLLNLAVGGDWAGNVNRGGIDDNVFPQTFAIDWVRVYECSASPATGVGCASRDSRVEVVEGHTRPELTGGMSGIAQPPLFTVFDGVISEYLKIGAHNPNTEISSFTEAENDRGDVLTVNKTGTVGNVFFNFANGSVDMSSWQGDGELVFDIKLNTDSRSDLLIKIDSGWPQVSDINVALPSVGEWQEVRISVADLVARGNSFAIGIASLSNIVNAVVIEPQGPMSISLDNIRFESLSL